MEARRKLSDRGIFPGYRNVACPESLGDMRFAKLLSPVQWQALPAPVRKRFSRRLAAGEAAVYCGEVLRTRLSAAGSVLAQLARLVGSPLPYIQGGTGAAMVCVTEAPDGRAQCWSRLYERGGKFPQVVHSMKRFAGPTGLEEYIGYGIGMALEVRGEGQSLIFESAHYFLQLSGFRLRLPRTLSPGTMRITHREEGGGQFSFTLSLVHPFFGELVHQYALFSDG